MKGIDYKRLKDPKYLKKLITENKEKVKKYGILIAILIALIILWLSGRGNEAKALGVDDETSKVDSQSEYSEESNIIYVDISGEVVNPGVYEVTEGARIFHVINMAGGLKESADTSSLNQAELVYDGEKIIVNKIDDEAENTSSGTSNGTVNGKVSINKADVNLLQTLPGIGASKAQRIIDYRENNGRFKSIDELKNVSGIGDSTFNSIKDLVCL